MIKTLSSIGLLAMSATTAIAGDWIPAPVLSDNGAAAGVILLLAIGAVLMLKGGAGASASQPRKDKAADEE